MPVTWMAHYENNEVLDQRSGATYANIDRERLTAFGLYRDGAPLVLIDFRDDSGGDPDIGPKRLIWRMRHRQNLAGASVTVHLAGWQRRVAGRNIQSICYINEEGTVILGGQWVEGRELMYPVAPLECEKDLA